MTKDEIKFLIHQLEQEHRYDKGGGYGLVGSLLKLRGQLNGSDQKKLDEVLLEMVANQEQTLWGIALEVLVQESSVDTPIELEKLLRVDGRNKEWEYQVILALLRFGYSRALDIYLAYIQSELSGNPSVAILLANLYRVDQGIAIKLSSEFFALHLSSENETSDVSCYIPAFVQVFAEKEEGVLQELVHQTAAINHEAGKRILKLISDYLSKPWIIKKWGQEKVNRIQNALTLSV